MANTRKKKSAYAKAGVDYTVLEPFKQVMIDAGKRTLSFPNSRGVPAEMKKIRGSVGYSFEEADILLANFFRIPNQEVVSIEEIIAQGKLFAMPDQLDISEAKVEEWNDRLKVIFANTYNVKAWHLKFQPSYLLRHEAKLYQEILGI